MDERVRRIWIADDPVDETSLTPEEAQLMEWYWYLVETANNRPLKRTEDGGPTPLPRRDT